MADALARDRLGPRPRTSIYVLLVAPGFFQIGDERNRLVGSARAVCGDDLDPRGLDVLGHAFGIAADIDVRAVGEPSPQLTADLAHAVLDVELPGAVARPGEREPGQRACGLHAGELVLVEEIAVATLVAEEQPVAPGRFARHAFVQEGAERRDAGAGTDHDDGHGRISRQTEMLRLLDVDLDLISGAHALAEEGGRDAEPRAAVNGVAHGIDAQRHAVAI